MTDKEKLASQLLEQLDGLQVPDESTYDQGLHHKAWRPFMDGMSDIIRQAEKGDIGDGIRERLKAAHEVVEEDPEYSDIEEQPEWSGAKMKRRLEFWSARRSELNAILNEA